MIDIKKQILIVSSSLNTGGLEKCLVNFCNSLDADKYTVDVYLFNEGRTLQKELNSTVNLLPESPLYYMIYNRPIHIGLLQLVKQRQWGLLFYKLGRFLRVRLHRDTNTVNDWRNMKKTMLTINKHYDVAIGFEEGTAGYYVAECVDATVKLCWVHTDIKMIGSNKTLDAAAYDGVDYVCTVSQNSLRSLQEEYPAYAEKMRCFKLPAMLDYALIDALAAQPATMRTDGINILSVGRLVELKGFHLCVEPLSRLVNEGYDVMWYVAGDGSDRAMLEAEIARYGMQERFILLGNCSNPYAYIQAADICVQPSRYEGFSVAVWEEKYLHKPVVATTIPSNFEILTDGINGLLVERDAKSIYTAVKYLLDNPSVCQMMAQASANDFEALMNTMAEIEKLF